MCPKLQILIYFDKKMSEKFRLLSLMVFVIFMFKHEFQCAKQWAVSGSKEHFSETYI